MDKIKKHSPGFRQIAFVLAEPANISDYIATYGDESGFEPHSEATEATNAPPGPGRKVEVLRSRIMASEELWHPEDCVLEIPASAYEILTGQHQPGGSR